MKKIFVLTSIIFSSLYNLSGQDVEYKNVDSLYHVIDSLYTNNADVEDIHKLVNLILKSDTLNANLFYFKGWYYDNKSEYEVAKHFYFRAITVDTLHFEALCNLGILFYNEGIKEFEIATQRTYRQYLELHIIASNKFRLSKIFFERAFSVNPYEPELIKILEEIKRRELNNKKFIDRNEKDL